MTAFIIARLLRACSFASPFRAVKLRRTLSDSRGNGTVNVRIGRRGVLRLVFPLYRQRDAPGMDIPGIGDGDAERGGEWQRQQRPREAEQFTADDQREEDCQRWQQGLCILGAERERI